MADNDDPPPTSEPQQLPLPLADPVTCGRCGQEDFVMLVTGHLQCRQCDWITPEPVV